MLIHEATLTYGALSILRDKTDALNRRAERLGLDPIVIDVVTIETAIEEDEAGIEHTVEYYCIEVHGKQPRINGWGVIARIEFTGGGNLVHTAPGVDSINLKYRTIGNVCEHCNTQRNRNDVIVIQHEDGRELVVGRNCLADYIRTEDASGLIEFAQLRDKYNELVDAAERDYEEGISDGRIIPSLSIETVLQAASLCIRKIGWTSGSKAYEEERTSTRDDVRMLLCSPRTSRTYIEFVRRYDLHTCEQDKELAAKALEWVRNIPADTDSDYLYNIRTICSGECIHPDKLGYAVSVIPAYKRDIERRAERKETNTDKQFVGEVGKRLRDLPVTVKRIRSTEGQYGVTTIIAFESDGNDLTWFASGDKTGDFEEGTSYTVDATVKKHEDDARYGKQTIVNRVRVK